MLQGCLCQRHTPFGEHSRSCGGVQLALTMLAKPGIARSPPEELVHSTVTSSQLDLGFGHKHWLMAIAAIRVLETTVSPLASIA